MVSSGKFQKNYVVWLLVILCCVGLSCLLPGTAQGAVSKSTTEIEVAPGEVITETQSVGEAVSGQASADDEGGGEGEMAPSHWPAKYGAINEISYATAIAVDREHDAVYVAGRVNNSNSTTGWDYLTIKYNLAGVEPWKKIYDGGANGFDEARAIATYTENGQTYVYVTGYSTGNGTGADIATIKYRDGGSVGYEVWTRRYLGSTVYEAAPTTDDYATAMIVDDQGNVYVTGATEGTGRGWDYVTIKYKPNGDIDQGWPRIYNHNPADPNMAGNRHDIPSAIALSSSSDPDGACVYVTGSSWRSATINGIVYQNYDYATVKYTTGGTLVRAKRYDGPGKGNDYASALAIDDTNDVNNVYVTGSALGTTTGYDFVTGAYKPLGDWLWGGTGVQRHAGSSFDFAKGIGVANGFVYVTGLSFNDDSSANFTTIQYNAASQGGRNWTRTFDKATLWDEPAGLVAKNDGVYVAGTTTGGTPSNNYTDGTARKYSTGGEVLKRYNYNCAGDAGFTALAVDDQGCLYVTGFSTDTRGGGNYKATTIRYNP
jgi:hypothetical protein